MRNFTITFLLFLLSAAGLCQAQRNFIERTMDYKRETYFSKGMAVSALGGNTWATASNGGPCNHVIIAAYDDKNIAKWHKTLNNIGQVGASDVGGIITTSSGNAIVAVGGYGYGVDVLIDAGSFIVKLDANGNSIWETRYNKDTFPVFGNGTMKKVAEAPDGNIYALTSTSGIAKVDANGKKIWEKAISSDLVLDIAATLDNGLMLPTKSGLIKLDANGNVLWSEFLGHTLHKISRLNNGNFAAMSSNTILLLDSSANVLGTSKANANLSFPYTNFTALAANDDALFVASDLQGTQPGKVILSIEPATFDINWISNLIQNVEVSDIAVKDSFLAVTGTEFSPEDKYIKSNSFRSFVKTFDLNGNTSAAKMDVGISRIVPGKVTARKVNTGIDSMKIYNVSLDVDVVIKNFGTTVADSVSAISLSDYYMFCASPTRYTHFSKLALQPGDSIMAQLGTVMSMNRYIDTAVDTAVRMNFCVSTVSPNGMLDYNSANDIFCGSFRMNLTGIYEQERLQPEIKLYPNPANNGFITLESTEPLTANISVINTLGQEMLTSKMAGEKVLKLQLDEIPAGVYFVKISSGKMNSTFKSIIISK